MPRPLPHAERHAASNIANGFEPARVLVACEFSATVRDAFRARGFDAWSCDVLPTEGDSRWHIQGDVLDALGDGWDLLIAHPPCTHLAVSGARWFKDKREEQAEALDFVRALLDAPIPRIALENPVSIISSRIRKPDFTLQPWQFGHGEVKRTCFWTKNLGGMLAGDTSAVQRYHLVQQQERQAQQQAAAAQAAELRKRSLDREDFIFEQDYRARNQPAPAIEQNADYIRRTRGDEAANQYLDNYGRQPQQPGVVNIPNLGTFFGTPEEIQAQMRTVANRPTAAPTADDWNSATPMTGGAGGNASGGFR